MQDTYIFLMRCPDGTGIVAKIAGALAELGCNIVKSDQYTTNPFGGQFFMRVEFVGGDGHSEAHVRDRLGGAADGFGGEWELHAKDRPLRMAIAVSKYDHCVLDLLYRVRTGDLNVTIPCVVSNHDDLRGNVESHGVAFHYLPVAVDTRADQEARFLGAIRDSDFLVLARYMQILSPDFLNQYGRDVINIHHSFLPSFKGADPYKQAIDRGVKVIGATAHYATADLDEGPIIAQVVAPISHNKDIGALKRRGRSLEQEALAEAVHAHCEHRVMRLEQKTIVFT